MGSNLVPGGSYDYLLTNVYSGAAKGCKLTSTFHRLRPYIHHLHIPLEKGSRVYNFTIIMILRSCRSSKQVV